MKLADLYSEYIANWISDGRLISRDKISLLGIKPLFDRYLTNQWITKTWLVNLLPVHFSKNLTQEIRMEMFKLHPNVRTIVYLYNSPVNVNVTNDIFTRQLKQAANRFYQYKDVFDQLSADEKLTGASERDPKSGRKIVVNRDTLIKIKDDYDSYSYVYEKARAGRSFTNTYYFIQASALSKKEILSYRKDLNNLLAGENVFFKELRGNIVSYLENMGPATFMQSEPKKMNSMLFSQENLACMLPSKTKGLVSKKGVLLAYDVATGLPFFLDLLNSGTAQVVLIEGKSGCGKTYLGFVLLLELMGLYDVHGSVCDIKGGEWHKLIPFLGDLKVSEIDMTGENARFVNLLRLDDLNCNNENCIEAYEFAVMGTVGLFESAINLQENEGNLVDLHDILQKAVEKVYSSHDVIKTNAATFNRTKELRYSDVLDVVAALENSRSLNEEQLKLCKLIRTRCGNYFLGEGLYSAAFKNELTLGEILESNLVIYNFNKNSGETLDTLDSIRVYMMQRLDGKKHFIRKQQKKHQVVFYEELQRCNNMDTLVEGLSAEITGSRSNNLTVVLLLNVISTFDSNKFAAIKSNITTQIIGKSNSADIRRLVDDYDCKAIEKHIQKVSESSEKKYQHSFAVQYDTGNEKDCLIIKTVVPPEMEKAFSTRDRVDDVMRG